MHCSGRLTATIVTCFLVLSVVPSSFAEGFDVEIVLQGLDRPTGIAVRGNNNLFFTEIPDPGVFGSANRVVKYQLNSDKMTMLSQGEPEPINLALAEDGSVYWACRTAGVILEYSDGEVAPFLTGLDRPTGIASGGLDGEIYFTQVPEPGVFGGANTVERSDGFNGEILSSGEPEPTDVAVSDRGDVYWTCKAAGVILHRDALGNREVLLDGLNAPTGIALSPNGQQLYFTEIPTPGIPGSLGGENRVLAYDLNDGVISVVNSGDPEPTDVAVAPNGDVYWTCSTAGVIAKATPQN